MIFDNSRIKSDNNQNNECLFENTELLAGDTNALYADLYIRESLGYIQEAASKKDNTDVLSSIDDKQNVKAIIDNMKVRLNTFLKNAQKIYSNVDQEINDIMTKINDLLKHDKFARWRHGNDKVNGSFPRVFLINKNNNKLYRFEYSQVYFNVNQLNAYMDQAEATGNFKQLENIFIAIEEWYAKYHSYIDYTNHYTKNTTYNNIKLKEALNVFETNIKVYYTRLSAINQIVSYELLYLNAIQKSYDGYVNKFKGNKEALAMVNKIYKFVLALTNRSMEWNMKGYEHCLNAFKSYAAQIEEYYKIIKGENN